MKEVFDVRRSADSDDVLKKLNGQFRGVITCTAAKSLEDVDSGSLVIFNHATAFTVTLPAPESGLYFDFLIKTASTDATGHRVAVKDTTDTTGDFIAYGSVTLIDDQVATETNACNGRGIIPAVGGTGDNTIILDSDATNGAGEAGSYFRLTAIDNQYWMVEGNLMAPTASTGADVFQHV
jgi:hypothetical protein